MECVHFFTKARVARPISRLLLTENEVAQVNLMQVNPGMWQNIQKEGVWMQQIVGALANDL